LPTSELRWGVGLPELLTVEEAARLIRVGRTKAYAMTREWRDTDGRSGLPVVDFGHVLRVPRHALEAMIGGPLDAERLEPPAATGLASVPEPVKEPADVGPVLVAPVRRRRRPVSPSTQPGLFDTAS
jgi:hypothetical protein